MADKPRGLLLVMIDVDPAHEEEFNRWYNQEHLPERRACPGFLSARRFIAVEGEPKYLALYDLESPDVLQSAAYQKIYPPSEWTKRVSQHFLHSVRNVYVEITPPAGGPVRQAERGQTVGGRSRLAQPRAAVEAPRSRDTRRHSRNRSPERPKED